MRRSIVRKTLKVLAVLTFITFLVAIVLAVSYLGDTRTIEIAGLMQTLFSYLIAVVLALLAALYFWSYPDLRGIKIFSTLVILVYGYSIFSLPFNVGDTIEWTPSYLIFTLFILSFGFVESIWIIVYFRKMGQID